MTNHILLDNVTHRNLRIKTDYSAGYDVNVARVFPLEFRALQNEYPLFFVRNTDSGDFESIALLGFSDQENLYLHDNRWDAAHLPLTIERQPLLIGFQEQVHDGVPSQVPVVHVDLDHPNVNQSEGEPIFLPQGGDSPMLERKTSVLMAIHQGLESGPAFSRLLVGLELVESLNLEIKFRDGSKQTLTGLYTINEEKLSSLNANGLEVLHNKGHLMDVYMMLASLPNMDQLIERKNRLLTA